MNTINGLPAHILLVHLVVVLAPLTAVLAITAAVWPAARRRLVWVVAAFAVITLAATPLTTSAGEWLEKRVPESEAVKIHTELGDSMLYFSIALLVVAAALVFVHLRENKGTAPKRAVTIAVAVLTLVVGIGVVVQVYRIGDSGARAVWEDSLTSTSAPAESDG
ncbi:MAG: DUF2231 domain-containing protein [Rhodococcus sp. (in: high G+C Gram-positive bacteria)]